jgi:hypothetical protein
MYNFKVISKGPFLCERSLLVTFATTATLINIQVLKCSLAQKVDKVSNIDCYFKQIKRKCRRQIIFQFYLMKFYFGNGAESLR